MRRVTRHRIPGSVGRDSEEISGPTDPPRSESLEVWPESHWPGFALRQADVFLVLYGMVVYAIRFNNQLLHRQSTLGKRRLGENRGFRPSF